MTPAAHIAHSKAAYQTSNVLSRGNNEWAAVTYFYAAYRAARAALLKDSRLDSDVSAHAVHARLRASSREVDFHKGHPSRGPGLNDIVRYLYPKIGPAYELLHIRSCEVRYDNGLTAGTVADCRDLVDEIIDEFTRLGLHP